MIYAQRRNRGARSWRMTSDGMSAHPHSLYALFNGPSGNDIVSSYTTDAGGAFAYTVGTAQLQGDGTCMVKTQGTMGGASNRFAALQQLSKADIPNQASLECKAQNDTNFGAFGIVLRYIDDQNFIFIYAGNTTFIMQEIFSNVGTTLASGNPGILWATGNIPFVNLTVTAKGTSLTASCKGVSLSGTCQNTTGTKFGIFADGWSSVATDAAIYRNWQLW